VHVVIPHVTLFATLVEWGESLVGVGLLLGAFTRFSGWTSIFLLTNYWIMRGAYSEGIGAYVDLEPALAALAGRRVTLARYASVFARHLAAPPHAEEGWLGQPLSGWSTGE
jgi:uncharacterized membrane protein YphA (DoxX/SURF4 family)